MNVLFESRDVPSAAIPRQYFDQRFIDYLAAQPEKLQQIHWRQFELLCGEFFRRHDYMVEVTPASGDGGIDVIATKTDPVSGPELVLVQAKRLAGTSTVKINEVKALYADLNERAGTKAFIVTTTKLEGGAKTFCDAHKFRMNAVENEHVREWVVSMSRELK